MQPEGGKTKNYCILSIEFLAACQAAGLSALAGLADLILGSWWWQQANASLHLEQSPPNTFLGHPKFQQCQVTMNSFRIMAVMEIVVAVVKTPNSCMEKTWHRPTAQTHAAPSNNAWILECIQFWPTMADLLFCLLRISSKSKNIPKFNCISMKIPSNLWVWSPDTLTPTQLLSMGSVTLGEAPAMLGPGALAVPGEAGREEPWRSTHQALHLTEMSAGMMTKYHNETKWSQIISDLDSNGWVSMFPYVFHMFPCHGYHRSQPLSDRMPLWFRGTPSMRFGTPGSSRTHEILRSLDAQVQEGFSRKCNLSKKLFPFWTLESWMKYEKDAWYVSICTPKKKTQ